jgi:hypothetical protein
MAETKDKKPSTNTAELGPKVLANISLEDKDFKIERGEIGYLPADYKERPGIMFYINRFEFFEKSDAPSASEKSSAKVAQPTSTKESSKPGETLDSKDVANFLNQNSKTVLKQLRINKLGQPDLDKLLIAERKGKNRSHVIKFIKTLKEVN